MKLSFLMLLICVLAGCASDLALRDGKRLIEQGRVEEGLAHVDKAARTHPGNVGLREYYIRNRDLYVNQLLYDGDKARMLDRLDQAQSLYQRALALHPDSERARQAMENVTEELAQREAVNEAQALLDAGKIDESLAALQSVLMQNPLHRTARTLQRRIEEQQGARTSIPALASAYREPISLEFQDAPLKNLFEVLSQASGVNFIFDRDVRQDAKTTIFLRDTPIEDAVNFLLATNQLGKKVLNQNTILVYPNLPTKARDYQNLVVKSFYLANADIKQTLSLIKTVLKTRDVFIDERLNLLVMRDTPEAIRMAEKLIAAQDLADPEVILEVEVLEVARSKLQELGLKYPTQISYGIEGATEGPGRVTLPEWLDDHRSELVRLSVTDPAFVINLRRTDGSTNILANPRIRVKNREKAKVHIGDRLPVITTTSTANVGVSESVTYLDVGLKLDVEPNVYLDDHVAMKVALEVSSIVQEIRSQSGALTYRLGTRNTATVLRVANGETQVLAGLIQDEDRRTVDKVPGLGELPLVGRLFRSQNDNRIETEIVLLITPYVVHNIVRPEPATLEFDAGTESSLGARSLALPTGAARTPADEPARGNAVEPTAPRNPASPSPPEKPAEPRAPEPMPEKRR